MHIHGVRVRGITIRSFVKLWFNSFILDVFIYLFIKLDVFSLQSQFDGLVLHFRQKRTKGHG